MITMCLIGVTGSLLLGFRANAGAAGKRLRAAAVAIAIAFLKQSYISISPFKVGLALLDFCYPDGTNPAGGHEWGIPQDNLVGCLCYCQMNTRSKLIYGWLHPG